MADKEIRVKVSADISDFQSKMKEVTSILDKCNKSFKDFGSETKGAFNDVSKLGKSFSSANKDANNLGKTFKDNANSMKDLKSEASGATEQISKFGSAGGKGISGLIDMITKLKSGFSQLASGNIAGGIKSIGGAFNGIKGILTGLTGTLASVTIAVVAFGAKMAQVGFDRFKQGLQQIITISNKIGSVLKTVGSNIRSAFESITGASLSMSSLMQVGIEFEYQMQRVGAIAGSNDKQLQQLTSTAERLGGTTQFTASQVGEAFEYMAMAGYSTDEMLASIEDTLNLAIISGTDLGTVSDIVTDGITAMGMSASDTGEFVDKMTATITSANTNVELFGETMKQCGALAGSLGVNMTDLSTAIGLMANAGVKGGRAGTSLKNVLSNMASPTKEQEKALKQLGLTADETGSYLKTTADGNVDLEATIKSLMEATKGMDKTQQASLLTTIAGKEAIAGLMSIMNQGEEAWNELSNTIENSTGKVQYWNECMSLAGKSGADATKLIESMKQVFEDTYTEAQALGMSTEDLSHAIAILGDDGKVTTENVKDLLSVIESMNSATGKTEEAWRSLDDEGDDLVNTGWNYDETITAITADTQGLTQVQKDELKNRLENVDTYEDAIQIASDYQKELKDQYGVEVDLGEIIKQNSFTSMTYAEKMRYLRDNMKDMSEEQRKAWLESQGLGEAFDEVNEVLNMSDEEFDAYTKNLETVQSMSEQLANAMDEVTKASLYGLASAIQNLAISVWNDLKPAVQSACDALTEFFNTWHNGDKNEFTFDGFEKGLADLEQKVRNAKDNITQAIVDLFSNIDRFVNGGSLDSILQIGTNIIDGICDGINRAKENGTLDSAISGAIVKISEWVRTNTDTIIDAGKKIADSIGQGIKDNPEAIRDAIKSVCELKDTIDYETGKAEGLIIGQNIGDAIDEGIINAILDKKTQGRIAGMIETWGTNPDMNKGITGLIARIVGENPNKETDTKQVIKYADQTIDDYKKRISERLSSDEITVAESNLISKALNRGEEAKKGADETTKTYINELQGQLANGEINESSFNSILSGLKQTSKAKESADETTKGYIEQMEAGLSAGTIDPSSVGAMLSVLSESEQVDLEGSKIAQNYMDALREQLVTGQITPDEFRVLALGDNFMENAKNYAKTNQINADDVIDAKSFSNVQEVNDLMDALDDLNAKYAELSGTITESCTNMADSTRDSFVGITNIARNQMVNVTNIVRNQAVNWSNIIRNQVTNARTTFTQQFMSMRSVARNQMVAISSIVRNQAVNWGNIIRNQAQNARDNLTRSFMSMYSVVSTQMAKCLSTVQSYMAQISSACNKSLNLKVNVSKTITTTEKTIKEKPKTIDALGTFNTLSTMSMVSGGYVPMSTAVGLGTLIASSAKSQVNDKAVYLEIPVILDGKQVAKSTAKYIDGELKTISNRDNRKKGN